MSNLLLLADVASKNSKNSSSTTTTEKTTKTTTAEIGVQTEYYYNYFDDPNCRPIFQQFPNGFASSSSASANNNNEMVGGGGNIFELPNLPPLHDYVKQTEFDYVVNSMHDYYNRIAQPDGDLEHSYAVFGATTTSDGGGGECFNDSSMAMDDGCFESIANLDEYMGLVASSSTAGFASDQLLCEEVIDGAIPMFFGEVGDELFDQLSIGSVDVDELIAYICPAKETVVIGGDGGSSSSVIDGERTIAEAQTRKDLDEPTSVATIAETMRQGDQSIQPSTSLATAIAIAIEKESGNSDHQREQTSTSICQWFNCGQAVDQNDKHSFERHFVAVHLERRPKSKSAVEKDDRWTCKWNGCNRNETFSHRYQLLRHLRQHTMEAPFHCSICDRSFKTKELLKVHERRLHNQTKTYACTVCSKVFASTGDLSRHRRTHISNPVSVFACDQCGSSYRDESGLRKHRKRVHESSIGSGDASMAVA